MLQVGLNRVMLSTIKTNFELLLCGINYGNFCHYKCTATWLGILCSNNSFGSGRLPAGTFTPTYSGIKCTEVYILL